MELKTYQFLVSMPVNQGGQIVTNEQGRNPVEAQKIVESRFPNATAVIYRGEAQDGTDVAGKEKTDQRVDETEDLSGRSDTV